MKTAIYKIDLQLLNHFYINVLKYEVELIIIQFRI